jgi:hypothetical protein
MDTDDRDFRKHHKFSQILEAIVNELSYMDSFRVLFPCTPGWTGCISHTS